MTKVAKNNEAKQGEPERLKVVVVMCRLALR